MIFLTDIGKDTDDAVALTYAIVAGVPIKTIITTSKNADNGAAICQNILDALADHYPAAGKIKVVSGSTKPIRGGEIHANTYWGPFSKYDKAFDKCDALRVPIDDVLAVCPLTDLVPLMEANRVNRVMFMGQAKKDGQTLQPDMEAYNFRCDPFASEAVFQFQDRTPFGFIGKTLAYRVPFTKGDFDAFEKTGHPVGAFLKDHAHTTFDVFKNNVPELYERVYKGTDNISYCYDPLTVLAVKHPNLFTFEKFGHHRIGADIDAEKAKETLVGSIVKGLK